VAPSALWPTTVVMVSTQAAGAQVLPQTGYFYESLPQDGAYAGCGDLSQ